MGVAIVGVAIVGVAIVGAAHQPAIRRAPASEVVRSVVRTPPRAAMIQAEMRKSGTCAHGAAGCDARGG